MEFAFVPLLEQQNIPKHAHVMECVCLSALLLEGSYVLMRCKWLQEVVSQSLNGMPLHLWSPDFGGLGLSLWCSLAPLTVSGELALSGVLTSMWQPPSLSAPLLLPPRLPLTVFSHELCLKKASRNRTACHIKYHGGTALCWAWKCQVAAASKQISSVTIYAKHFIFSCLCFEVVFWCFWRSNRMAGI